MYDVVIIGAGPAGLTAGYELSKSTKKVLILEKKHQVGGLAETKVFGDYRYDIGPHRFFTKNEEVFTLFLKMLGDDAVKVDRKTRILFKNSYFDYPLSPLNALFGLGLFESIQIGFSYFYARCKGYLRLSKIENFEDWVVDKFGQKLYSNFFKNYTEKVWGIDCKEIGKDWAAQRIKGLSLTSAIFFSIFPNSKRKPKTLIDVFYYPRLGAGMLWEKFEDFLNANGVEVSRSTDKVAVNYQESEKTFTFPKKTAKVDCIGIGGDTWGVCSQTCGPNGKQTKTFKKAAPARNGGSCPSAFEERPCNRKICEYNKLTSGRNFEYIRHSPASEFIFSNAKSIIEESEYAVTKASVTNFTNLKSATGGSGIFGGNYVHYWRIKYL